MQNTNNNFPYEVRIEIKRVQSYLFAVPRLKAMIGSNIILGETIRGARIENGYITNSLPALAVYHNSPKAIEKLIDQIGQNTWNHCIQQLNKVSNTLASQDDVLIDEDNPASDFQNGVFIRDGGRFKAIFCTKKEAESFVSDAQQLITKKLPGILLDININPFGIEGGEKKDLEIQNGQPHYPILMPFFGICEESGVEIASQIIKSDNKDRLISASLLEKEKADNRMKKSAEQKDIASLLYKQFLSKELFGGADPPRDFKELCHKDYLAVIHADGNHIGTYFSAIRNKILQSYNYDTYQRQIEISPEATFELEYKAAIFFYIMRSIIRCSLLEAIKSSYKQMDLNEIKMDNGEIKFYHPFRMLMLGGDDLLFLSRSDLAFSFLVNYAKSIKKYSKKNQELFDTYLNGIDELTNGISIGAGVVIAKPNFPFHQLHDLAEELAGSAKRLTRAKSIVGKVSVVDWIVSTDTHLTDLASYRKNLVYRYSVKNNNSYKNEKLILSRTPLVLLKDDIANSKNAFLSLEGLLEAAYSLEKNKPYIARNKLKYISTILNKGRLYSELMFRELPKTTKEYLKKIGFNTIWDDLETDNSETSTYVTSFLDVVNIYEIKYLKTAHN